MIKVVFVGDAPSSKNIDPNVAFIGTPSHKNLIGWLAKLNCNDYILINSNTEYNLEKIAALSKENKIVALGKKAGDRLAKIEVAHFKMPHPSPLNRILNDESKVNEFLEMCREYINETRCSTT